MCCSAGRQSPTRERFTSVICTPATQHFRRPKRSWPALSLLHPTLRKFAPSVSVLSVQQQTFRNFEAIISVDGGDQETAAVCRPFLSDPRFRMIIHPNRLDWVGNFNWLLQQDLQEFFC